MLYLIAIFSFIAAAGAKHCNESAACLQKPDTRQMTRVMELIKKSRERCEAAGECPKHIPSSKGIINQLSCTNGMAGQYPCKGVDMKAFVNFVDLGSSSGGEGNDIWGWKSPAGRLYALTGQTDGMSVVDVTVPTNPQVLGFLPSKISRKVIWRDIKVYKNFAFIVADGSGHGMQVLDLDRVTTEGRILKAQNPEAVPTLTEDAYYTEFGNSHNVFVNEDTGYLYSVGTSTCAGGLHIVDVRNAKTPKYAGCFSSDGYTHDVQCVVYNGPDTRYTGKEICFAFNEDTLTLVDVTDKSNMKMISRKGYDGVEYCHQGWLTTDQKYLLVDDELDEVYDSNNANGKTETYVWDVRNLEEPKLIGTYFAVDQSVDHNLYIVGNRAYETNYENGLRILSLDKVSQGKLEEIGYFDVYPQGNAVDFLGSWSSYPFWLPDHNIMVVQSIDRGLFVLSLDASLNATQRASISVQ